MLTFKDIPENKKQLIKDFVDDIDNKAPVEQLKTMKKIMNLSFGEDNNQIIKATYESVAKSIWALGSSLSSMASETADVFKHWISVSCLPFSVIIRYPKIKITNSKGSSHEILDLWVRFQLDINGRMYSGITGLRSVVTKEEYLSAYAHSHLQQFAPSMIGWSAFCTGIGEINQVIALLRSRFDEANFTLFCIHLNNYVVWESLEGTPYNHMSNIGCRREQGSASHSVRANTVDTIVDFLEAEFIKNPNGIKDLLKITITNKKIQVEKTDALEEKIVEIIESWVTPEQLEYGRRGCDWMLAKRNTTGEYFQINATLMNEFAHQTTPIFEFKGEPIYFKVLNVNNEIENQKFPNPDITNTFCDRLSNKFTKAIINRKTTDKKEDNTEHIREVAKSDILPVSAVSFA